MKIIYAIIAGTIVAVGIAIFAMQTQPKSPHYLACMQNMEESSSMMRTTADRKGMSHASVCGCVADETPAFLNSRIKGHGGNPSDYVRERFTNAARGDAAMVCLYPNG